MIRVLIADDETRICKLIVNLINWPELGMEIAGIAYNGIDALELIRTKDPHLVITDIRMPGYDGLEMIERAKQTKKNLEFILISGYEEFSHAQKAMSFGVKDYLTKPINKENLLSALKRASESIQMRDRQERLAREYENVQKDLTKIRASFVKDLVLSDADHLPFAELEEINHNYYFQFQRGLFRLAMIQIDSLDPSRPKPEGAANHLALKFEATLQDGVHDAEILEHHGSFYVLLNYALDQKETIHQIFEKNLIELKQTLSPLGIMVTIGLGKETGDLHGLKHSLETAQAAIDDRILKGTGQMIAASEVTRSTIGNEESYFNLQKKLMKAIELVDGEKVKRAINNLKEELYHDLKSSHWISGSALKRLVRDIVDSYYITMRNNKVKIPGVQEERTAWEKAIDDAYSLDLLFQELAKGLTSSLTGLSEGETTRNLEQIGLAKLYIEEHYMESVSLEDLGSYLGFNPSYFSSLFKKETGTSFLEYLVKIRMEKAKELLKDSDLRIQDICLMVGYNDLRHFRKLFTQTTGLSPKEFRRLFT